MRSVQARLVAAVLLLTCSVGCFNPFDPEIAPDRSVATPPPTPNTPRNLLLLLEWAYERQDITTYEELFTADYRFAFAAEDSAGSPPLTRDDEIQVARHLFIGGSATEPPANRIILEYSSDLIATSDSRPGKTAPWHRQVTATVNLRVETDDLTHTVNGRVRFFVVRGDSAQVPEDLQKRGIVGDANRWFIERWEDQTGAVASLIESRGTGARDPAAVARVGPANRDLGAEPIIVPTTWSALKRVYLAPRP